ncbi:hypothetical protein TNCV_1348491 [Trichonephila clavipes]|nr:hypothetical protein TNCV_1348491 [Trichonephila clavipes]
MSGKGKLTDSLLTDCKNYYGLLFVANVGNHPVFKQNVIAAGCVSLLIKCRETDACRQCPIGKDSWCYYQRTPVQAKKPNEKI